MNLKDILIEKGYTIYKLSKDSGVSKTTLFDIFSGKSNILDCRLGSILKICNTLDISIYDVVNLEPILYNPFF